MYIYIIYIYIIYIHIFIDIPVYTHKHVGSAYPKDTKDCARQHMFFKSVYHISCSSVQNSHPKRWYTGIYTNRSMWVQPILKTLKTARQHMFFKRRPPLQFKSVYHISCSSTQLPTQTVIPVYTHRSMWVQPILKTLKTARQQVFLRCEPPEAFLL